VEARLLETLLQVTEVAAHDWTDIGVCDHGRGPLILAVLARQQWYVRLTILLPSGTGEGSLVVFGRNNPSPYTVNGRPLYVHLNGLAIVLLK